MNTPLLRLAFLGLVVSFVAYVPAATTALSTSDSDAPSVSPCGSTQVAECASAAKLSPREQKFVQHAYARGLFEIEAGQVALESTSVNEVRLLAAHILRQRTGMHEQLGAFAKAKGMAALPERLDAGNNETLEVLQEASGDDDFDLRYCGMVVAGYLRDIKAFQEVAEKGSDADLRRLAADVASGLKQHLAIALVIQRALASVLNDTAAPMSV